MFSQGFKEFSVANIDVAVCDLTGKSHAQGNNTEVDTSKYADFDGAVELVSKDIMSDSTTITSPATCSSAAELSGPWP